MKTTMPFRSIANPRRTTLAHLDEAELPQPPALPGAEQSTAALPTSTANPRRTVLMDLPTR